jgi:hypothetical protein
MTGCGLCEHAFVAAQGSAYARLKRAIERRNVLVAWATAAELPRVELGDALALVLLALDHDAPRFEKAALRWHSRLCREAPLTIDEAQLALAALGIMQGPSRAAGADALLAICDRHNLRAVTATLERWLNGLSKRCARS